MALITPSTFDPLKFRCAVRLQQGVPIVDADWNELDDIRKFEMRAYLKWFVGDGLPAGIDAFRIEALAAPAADDFVIRAAAPPPPAGTSNADIALRNVGRFIVDGLDVLITADVRFKAQTLEASLPAIQPIPNVAGAVAIYLDVWERLITSQEDPSLVLPGLGVESAARMRREWCVRARQGGAAPVPGDGDYRGGHGYAVLAVLDRKVNGGLPAPIASADITDKRHARLTLADVESRLALLEKYVFTPAFTPSPNEFDPKFSSPGKAVKLFGANLNYGIASVKFGTVESSLTGQQSDNQITVLVPSMPPGPVPIRLVTAGGTIVTTDKFNVLAPVPPVFAASPNQFDKKIGSKGVTTQVTLFGSHFNQANLAVTINGQAAPIIGAVSDTQVTVSVGPVASTGAFTFHLQNAAGSVDSTDTFTFTP